ncbi:Mediator of RNA polymerase II transcription subunit 19 [Trichoplax sp. H2]|nr:Mediator of RNA polymerase II transcription subunit 19 [Trichoplax sp. H2]|eukprot:RDD40007.1 Mediator of RNA polymerase II transcription subunit 19 [Trichoplax sp. H2]
MESGFGEHEKDNSTERSKPDRNRNEFSNFYLLSDNPVVPAKMSGASNLIVECDLIDIYNQYHGRKLKENLSTFLPELPGRVDVPVTKADPGLSGLIDKPPIGGRELLPLSNHSLSAFHLMPGKAYEIKRHKKLRRQEEGEKKKKKKEKKKKKLL